MKATNKNNGSFFSHECVIPIYTAIYDFWSKSMGFHVDKEKNYYKIHYYITFSGYIYTVRIFRYVTHGYQ